MINNLLKLLQIFHCQEKKGFVRSLYSGKWTCSLPGLAKPTCLSRSSEFDLVTDEDVLKLIRSSTIKACKLDPLPATIIRSCYSALVPVLKTVIKLSLSTGSMPEDLKIASLRPLVKKPNADCEQFSNQRPVSNMKFLSKLEKEVCICAVE